MAKPFANSIRNSRPNILVIILMLWLVILKYCPFVSIASYHHDHHQNTKGICIYTFFLPVNFSFYHLPSQETTLVQHRNPTRNSPHSTQSKHYGQTNKKLNLTLSTTETNAPRSRGGNLSASLRAFKHFMPLSGTPRSRPSTT